MADRRPLAAAVNTYGGADVADVRAFITQERPINALLSSTIDAASTLAPDHLAFRANEQKGINIPDRSTENLSRSTRRKTTRLQPVGLIPVTIRLRPEIAGALKRASLERQLSGEEVFTQQELVEGALEPWLIDKGYMSGKA